MRPLRNPAIQNALAWTLAQWMRFCIATIRWTHENEAAAEAFFSPTAWTKERIAALREENRVASEEYVRFRRASQRARAIAYAGEHPEAIAKLCNVDKPRAARLARERAEAERMDAIAKHINDRLRSAPRRTPTAPLPNPTNPHRQGPQR